MKHSTKELNIRYFWLQVLFWGAAVVHYAYMTQILQSKGFTEVEIGVLNSVKLLVGVVFQVWIGAFADRTRYTIPLKYLIAVLSVGAGILTVALCLFCPWGLGLPLQLCSRLSIRCPCCIAIMGWMSIMPKAVWEARSPGPSFVCWQDCTVIGLV